MLKPIIVSLCIIVLTGCGSRSVTPEEIADKVVKADRLVSPSALVAHFNNPLYDMTKVGENAEDTPVSFI